MGDMENDVEPIESEFVKQDSTSKSALYGLNHPFACLLFFMHDSHMQLMASSSKQRAVCLDHPSPLVGLEQKAPSTQLPIHLALLLEVLHCIMYAILKHV